MKTFSELDIVALLRDIPEENLRKGDVGTIVHLPGDRNILVEFTDEMGQTTGIKTLPEEAVLKLNMNTSIV